MSRAPRRRVVGGSEHVTTTTGSRQGSFDSSDSNAVSTTTDKDDSPILWLGEHDNDKEHKTKKKQRRYHKQQQQQGHTAVLRIYERILSTLLVLLFFVTVGVLSLYVLPAPTPGLLTKHPLIFDAVPTTTSAAGTICIDDSEQAVMNAFQSRGWTVIPLKEELAYKDCHMQAKAAVIWTKNKPKFWGKAQPWQRHNWLPFQNVMSRKSTFQRLLNNYTAVTGRHIEFVPTSFVLPDDRERLLQRLQPAVLSGSSSSLRLKSSSGKDEMGGGDNEPWVVKLSATDNGIGIAIVGPQSDQLKFLTQTLQSTSNASEYMPILREKLVLQQPNDTRDPAEVAKARHRSIVQNDQIIVQRYVCHELDYQTHKFDLRIYFLVASVDPLVVFYHDGSLRVALAAYNDQSFGSTSQHLTNIGRNLAIDNCTASFDDWQLVLHNYVTSPTGAHLPDTVKGDPLGHVRNQIKAALADLVAAARDKAFRGYRTHTTMQNGFALMGGDFIVDRDLHVWMTECQSSPGLGHATKTRKALYAKLLPYTADIVAQVMEKQASGLPLFPMENTGSFELIYTDDFHYKYDFVHKEQRGPC